MTRIRTLLAALVMVAAGAAPAWAQAQALITSRTPSRGDAAGGTTVELLGTGWFSLSTTVTMSGAGPQPTNVVVDRNGRRLTFVTPPRPASLTGYVITVTSGTTVRTTNYFYVARVRSGVQGARKPAFSYDGRYVAFESRYALTPGDTNGLVDIYVRNRLNGTVRRVSIPSGGGQALGGESGSPAISATGRFIAFQSRATNLVPGDTNGLVDIFLHDRDADGDGVFDEAGAVVTERVNVGLTTGPVALPTQAVGGGSTDPVVSGNGRYIAYQSAATNLLGAGDTNGKLDIFVFDRQRRLTRRVSTNGNFIEADDHSRNPAMSLSGRFVVFESFADNLAGGNPGTPLVPISDIFLHDRDTDGDGVFDERGGIDTQLVSRNRCQQNLTNHSIEPSITYDGRFVVFATVAGNANVDEICNRADFNGARDIFIWDRLLGTVTRRLSEGGQGELPGASGAPIISGNGNLLLFRTQAMNSGGGSAPGGSVGSAVVDAAVSGDGKSTTGEVPSPTTDTPPPADVPPPPPTGSTEEPATSGDGNTTGNTTEPDPGTGDAEPVVELEELPEDEDGTPSIGALSPSSGTTAGGNVVEIWGANFQPGAQTTVRWNGVSIPFTFVNSALVRVTAPPSPTGFDTTVSVRVVVNLEASNEVEYNYVGGLVTPTITSLNPANPTGPVTGGTQVIIAGSGFSTPSVRFGALAGTITNAAANSITVTSPATNAVGPVSIVVQNGNGTTAVASVPFVYTFAPPVGAPTLAPLVPANGPVTGGTAITINGSQFAPGATVTVGGVPATDVQVLSNTQIVAVTPVGAEGPSDVVVSNVNGPSAPRTFVYDPLTAPVLTCDLGADADADAVSDPFELQFGLDPADGTDGALDSDADGRTNAQECADLTHPRGLFTRYLAEGATGSFFDTRVVLANPAATPARVLFRFLTQSGAVVRHFLLIPATSRRTIDLGLLAGLPSANVSSVIESDVHVVVDRTMRWDQISRGGAHAESSSPAPSLTWYLAEGATHGSFSLFYLIQNPSQTQSAQVRIRYLLPAGAPIEQDVTVAPNTRATIQVDEQPGLGAVDVSGVVQSLNGVPIIVERAMYSSAAGLFAAGHDSAGVTSPSLQWFFAEGATGSFFDTFVLLANPNASVANVTATYLLPSGQTVNRNYVLQPNSRTTINVQEQSPQLDATAVSVQLVSTNGVTFLAERSMWWPHGQPWIEAHNAAGATTTGTKWAVADGEVGLLPEDTATFLLVANTAAVATTVRVTLLFETGAAISQDFTVPGNARFNVPVLSTETPAGPSHMRVPRGTRFSAVIESLGATPIVVERAMYWNANGQLWAAGSDLLATKLQ
jgi:Tol biopolymer transport system component